MHVRGGRIAGVTTGAAGADRHALVSGFARHHGHKLSLLDYGDAVVGPGLVDAHAHLNEPGREEWEGAPGAGGWGGGGVGGQGAGEVLREEREERGRAAPARRRVINY